MSVLAAEVEGCEPPAVLDVGIGLGLAQELDRLAETLPGGLVKGGVSVLKKRPRLIIAGEFVIFDILKLILSQLSPLSIIIVIKQSIKSRL